MNGAEAIAGRFELVSPLARGSMGEVHSGRDLQTGDTSFSTATPGAPRPP